ncbi:hypothetical protein CNEO_170184 [Clostridium neonatale]|nr:hypothetical protein CNEO_170184 [Clostridium neonatale]
MNEVMKLQIKTLINLVAINNTIASIDSTPIKANKKNVLQKINFQKLMLMKFHITLSSFTQ